MEWLGMAPIEQTLINKSWRGGRLEIGRGMG